MINQQVLEGHWNEIRGRLRERWGELNSNELDQARGNVQQLIGLIQTRTGKARDQIEQYLDELTDQGASRSSMGAAARQYAEQGAETVRVSTARLRESARLAARQAADQVLNSYEGTEQLVKRHPLESLAVCFGAGMLAGVVLGLTLRSR